jgi:hypothetical protein
VKRLFSLLFAFVTPAAAMAAGPDPQIEATNAAKDWLVLIDRGDYHAGWNEAAPSLKTAEPREPWTDKIAARRNKLGALYVREVTRYQFKPARSDTDLHAAIVHFRSQYAKSLLKETVRLERTGGTWKIAQYSLG